MGPLAVACDASALLDGAFALFVTGEDGAAFSLRLLCQTAPASGPSAVMNGFTTRRLPSVIWVIVRFEATDWSSSSGPPTLPSTAPSSRCLISIQLFLALPILSFLSRTRTQDPCIRSPSMTNLSSPLARAELMASNPFSGAQYPRSHSMTVPPPYCPFGIVPSKSP